MAYTEQQVLDILQEAVEQKDLVKIEKLQRELFENADHGPTPFSAAVKLKADIIEEQPDPTIESAAALNILNATERAKRYIIYQIKIWKDPTAPVIVCEGDSWFQYPIRITETIDHLIETDKYAIYSLGAAGDTIENMVKSGEYLTTIEELNPVCFLFSGGGNDLVGKGKLAKVLKKFSNQTDPSALIHDANFKAELDKVIKGIEQIIKKVAEVNPSLPTLMHGYDHPHNITKGPWIWPPMEKKGIKHPMALKIIAELIDRYNFRLMQLANQHNNFFHINVTGLIDHKKANWFDALHPTSKSFKIVADKIMGNIKDARRASETDLLETTRNRPLAKRRRAVETISAREAIINTTRFQDTGEPVDLNICPENEWRRFNDSEIHKQIKDVIRLHKETARLEDCEIIQNRVRFNPQYSLNPIEDLDNTEYLQKLTESIANGNDLEPIQSLMEGYKLSKAVGLVQIMSSFGIHAGSGSGFLVGENLFLTNHHVLQSENEAARSIIVFDNEVTLDGTQIETQRFRITPDIFYTSKKLDFSFVSIEPINATGISLNQYPILPLISSSGKAIKREPISIIQHPGGRPKMIANRNSYVLGRVDEGIYYTTDTEGGSSGSPVVNREWQVVALHHRTVPHPCERDEFIANRGIRISSIFEKCVMDCQAGDEQAALVLEKINPASIRESAASYFDKVANLERRTSHPSHSREHTDFNDETLIEDGAYEDLTEEEFLTAIEKEDLTGEDYDESALKHAFSDEEAFEDTYREALPSNRDSVLTYIGQHGLKFIVAHEVSSRTYYNRRLKNPIKPGGASGITIGIGYDLGYQKLSEFRQHWGGLLSNSDMRALERCLGATRSRASNLLPSVRHISVSFEAAMEVFKRASLPKYFRLLNRHMKDRRLLALHPHCIAALVSLTFNRGASYALTGGSRDNYREMRAIKAAVNNGNYRDVPAQLRAMKRLWRGRPNVRGLLRRREEEAELFEHGLRNMRQHSESHIRETSEANLRTNISYDDLSDDHNISEPYNDESGSSDDIDTLTFFYSSPDGDEQSQLEDREEHERRFSEAARPKLNWRTPGAVKWVSNYQNNPDTWHLPDQAEGRTFALTSNIIEKAIELGAYQPQFSTDETLIVGIRGARLASGQNAELNQSSISLTEQKPDHRTFRCVIMVYKKVSQTLSAFRASTVPNRGGIAAQYNKENGYGGYAANMLPTGCYELCVGTHYGSMTVPNVLRLGTGPTVGDALRVTTLRTINDGIYGTADFWDNCIPKDNIHPAFSAYSADFSSLGCLTIPGTYNGQHRGQWSVFRKEAGFDGQNDRGKTYNLLLTSGMELSAIESATANNMSSNDANQMARLTRLSHGSQGEKVKTLQQTLGITADGDFGAKTKQLLCKKQNEVLSFATGIWTQSMAEQMGQSSAASEAEGHPVNRTFSHEEAISQMVGSFHTDDGTETENDIYEFQDSPIGDSPDFSSFGENYEADVLELNYMFEGSHLEAFNNGGFAQFIRSLNLRHFKPAEFLFLGGSNRSGRCKRLNTLPPQSKWSRIGKTARMLDEVRDRLGAPINILSCYRSPAYNRCIGGARNSHHVKFNAIDWRCSRGSPREWLQVARDVRRSNREFKGGIGLYTNSRFIHIDTRGSIADWGS